MLLSSIAIGVAFPLNISIFKNVVNILVLPTKPESCSKELWPFIVQFGILASASFICGFIQMICVTETSVRQSRRYKHLYYSALLRQEIGWFDVQQTGQLMTKMTDDMESIEVAVSDKLAQFVLHISSFIGSIITAFVSGWKLSLVGSVAIPIMTLTFIIMVHFIKKNSIAQIYAYGVAGGIAEEIISGVRTVVAFNAQDYEIERYSKNLTLAEEYGTKTTTFQGLCIGIVGFTIYAVGALVFYMGINYVSEGTYPPGMVIQVFLTIVIGSISLGNAAPMISNFMVAKAAAYPIFEVIDKKPSINILKEGFFKETFDEDIHFKNVHFEYPARAGIKILEDFTFTIPNGKTVAFIGPSGSGKSTVIQLIQRFYDPLSGSVSFGDTNLKDVDLKWYRSNIGVVQQEPSLFAGTVEDNIKLGRENATFHEVVSSSHNANAFDFIMQTKDQFNTELGDLGAGFSGGQKQRIAIATALIREPSLLLLDEATSALDNKSEKLVQNTLDQQIRSGKRTIVMVAHRLQTVRDADIIVVMKRGKIIEQGNHDQLMELQGLYYEMLEIQKSKEATVNNEATIQEEEDVEIMSKTETLEVSPSITKEDIQKLEKLSTFQIIKDFGRIMKLNRPETCLLTFGILCSILAGCVPAVSSLIYSEMFNVFSYQSTPSKMIKEGHLYCALMLIPAFMCLIFDIFKNHCLGKAGEKLTTRIRTTLMGAMLKQEMAWFDKPENIPGMLTGKLALDASLVKGIAGIQLSTYIEAFVNVVVSLSVGFYFSWMLTLLFFIFMPFITITGIMQGKLATNQNLTGLDAIQSTSIIMETLNNIKTVQSLGLQNHFSFKFLCTLKSSKRKTSGLIFCGLTCAFGTSAFYFAYCVVFYVGGILIDQGKINMIELMRVFACLSMSAAALGRSLALTPDAEKGRLATRRTLEIIDKVTEIDACDTKGIKPEEKLRGDIELKNIHFSYPTRMNVPVLKGLNLKVEAGQTVALVGHSGCGKSTLIQLLERYYDPLQSNVNETSQILLDGHDFKFLNLGWVRNQLGLVKQEPSLFNLSITENIAYGKKVEPYIEDIIHVAKMANIHDYIESLPEGYNTKVGQRGGHLSGGQKQRICIARALYNKPAILMLDEATSALDTESEKVVQEALDRARENCTCLIIAHRLSTIQNADKIVYVEDGNVLEMGTHDELMSIGGAYFQLNVQHIN